MITINSTLFTLETFRRDLRTVMSERRLTQQMVEAISGVPQSTISSFLKGKRGLSAKSMLLLWPFVYDGDDGDDGEECEDCDGLR